MGNTERLTVSGYLQLFTKFTKKEKLKIAEKINQLPFEERWQSLDQELPNIEMTQEDIIKEVQAVRYEKESQDYSRY